MNNICSCVIHFEILFWAYWRHRESDYENWVFLILRPLHEGMKRHCFA